MKVKELMERVGLLETGRATAYIKDGIEELAMLTQTNVKTGRMSIVADQRYYDIPMEAVRITDVRVKNHNNSQDQYRSIPRTIHPPPTEDADGI